MAQANTLADLRGWSRFVGLQARYNLLERDAERDLLPRARALDLALLAWGALGSGLLSGKYNSAAGASEPGRAGPMGRGHRAQPGRRPGRGGGGGRDRLLAGPGRPQLGARTLAQMQDNLGCLDHALGFPHDFLASGEVRDLVSGGTWAQIDNHHA